MEMNRIASSVILFTVVFLFGCKPAEETTVPPLGKVDFPISCSSAAQSKFEHGLALLHNMMYAQAEKEFASVTGRDPDCAG
jgi:hypothetical protein